MLCADCHEQLTRQPYAVCRRCAARVPETLEAAESCPRCQADRLRFDATFFLGPYEGLLRDLVIQMKTDRSGRIGSLFAALLFSQVGEQLRALDIDVVVPIPTTRWKRLLRGTNPPGILAERAAAKLGVPCQERSLVKSSKSLPQHGLSRVGRFRNIRGGLAVGRGYYLESPHILLVDDVLTTGATCSEAAKVLKQAGAAAVSVLVVGRTFQE